MSEKRMYLILYTCAGSTHNRIISSVGSPQSVLDRFIKGRKLTNVLGIYEMHQCEGVKLHG